MDVRSVGVEEELLVVDPRTWSATSRAREIVVAHDEQDPNGEEPLDPELFRHQLEIRTDPTHDAEDLLVQVVAARRTARRSAESCSLAVAASATAPLGVTEPRVTRDPRYEDMVERFGDIAPLGSTCGMHVHVSVGSDDEGVACLDRIAPWLPVLLAMSTNSPFLDGRDTGYASWRTQMWSSWPSAGPSEAFEDVAGYRRACDRMVASGAARDPGMLYWDARLSVAHSTVEVRVLDVVTDPEDTVLLPALVRALVATAADDHVDGTTQLVWRSEELRAARWRASRYGLADKLVDVTTHELRPAAEVVASLRRHVEHRLEEAGDALRVDEGVTRILAGTGATRQRAAYERTGSVEGVVADLVERTA